MATTITQTTSSNTAITMDVSSLAGDDNLLAGIESAEIDNTANNYVNAIVNVDGITGHATTAPAIGDTIQLYVWGADTSLASTAIDVLDGTSSAETLDHDQVRNALKLAGVASVTVATAAKKYYIQPFAVAPLFGGVMPKFWGLFLVHNLGATLAASQSALFSYNGITYTST